MEEHFRCLRRVAFNALERDVGIDDFLHSLLDADNVVKPYGAVQVQVAIISFRYGVFQRDTSLWVEVFYCLGKNEAKRTEVGAHPRRVGDIEEFYVLVVVHSEVEVFYLVVDFCAYYAVRHIQSEALVNLQKIASFGETSCLIDVFTIYL